MLKSFLLSLLLLPVAVSAQMQMRAYTNIADMVAHASPKSLDKAVLVLGYNTFGDGGGGLFVVTNTVANTNVGSRFQSQADPTKSFEMVPAEAGVVNAKRFGAKCDGTSDDSAAITAAINYLGALGGQVYIPGKSKFNLVLSTNQNVILRGDGAVKDYASGPPTSCWMPYNTSQPLIQVGNDSALVRGFGIQNATLYGGGANATGLFFAGGAFESDLFNISVWNFKTNFLFMAGSGFPCSIIHVSHFSTQPSTASNARAIYAIMPQNQASFTTGIYFSHGHVNGPTGSGSYAAEIDGTSVSFTDVYFDLGGSGKGVKFSKTYIGVLDPYIDASGLTLDSGNSADVVINVPTNEAKAESWIKGRADIDGKIQVLSGTTYSLPVGSARIPYQSELSWPQIAGQMSISDGSIPWQGEKLIYNDGALVLDALTGNIKFLSANNISLIPTNGGVLIYGGAAGGATIVDGALYMDNTHAIQFKDPSGTYRSTLYPFSTNVQLYAVVGNLAINANANINLTPGAGVLIDCTSSSSHAFTLRSADFYLDNNRVILGKDSVGTYRNLLVLDSANVLQVLNAAGDAWYGSTAGSGLARIYAGGSLRWIFAANGNLLPQSTYDIGTSLARAGTGYFTALNLPGGDVATLIAAKQDGDSDLTAVAGLSSTGFIVRTGSGTATTRSITAGTGVSVSNGDGVSGNVVISATGEANTASNLGAGTGVFASKSGVDLRFNSLVGRYGVSVGAASGGEIPIDLVVTNDVTIALSNPTAAVSTGTSKNYWRVPRASTVKSVTAIVLVASGSGSVTLDLKKNGTTILSAPVSISAGATTATATVSVSSLAAGDILTGDINAAGDSATRGVQLQMLYTSP